jgi:hypothetical protein
MMEDKDWCRQCQGRTVKNGKSNTGKQRYFALGVVRKPRRVGLTNKQVESQYCVCE